MSLKPEFKRISYQKMATTQDGINLWQYYMTQVSDIALQYPSHFFSNTARKLMPADAQRHHFYVYVNKKNAIITFAIVLIAADQAEILWLACHKRYIRQGYATNFLHYIEEEVFDKYPVSKMTVWCCSEDTFVNVNDETVGGQKWIETHKFFVANDYNCEFKLENYWGDGSHALIFVKHKNSNEYHGYDKRYHQKSQTSVPTFLDDQKELLNELVVETIWLYLDAFDEKFVQGFSSVPGEETERSGITGLMLVDGNNETCTIFAQKSREPVSYEPDMRFEYDIKSSMLTRELFYHEKTEGVIYYPGEWDKDSEINISYFFKKYYERKNSELSSGYSVFFKRQSGEGNHCSILYYVTPVIPNVVFYLPLWRSLAYYSFALALELYAFLSSFLIQNPKLKKNTYFNGLMKSVSLTEINKVAKIRKKIDESFHEHQRAILHYKDLAFRNTGHLMRNRCEIIERHLKEITDKDYKSFIKQDISQRKNIKSCDIHMYLAMHNAQILSDCFQSLQLWGFESIDAVWDEYVDDPEKLERYFKETKDRFDLGGFIYEEALSVIEKKNIVNWGDCIVTLSVHESKRYRFWLKPKIQFPTSFESSRHFRLSDYVLSNLFFEVFLNAVRHGMINNDNEELSRGYASISIGFAADFIDTTPVLTVFNDVSLISDEARVKYEAIPETFKWADTFAGRGLGLVARGLSELEIGNIWVRRFTNDDGDFYEVAVALKGLEIEEF
jgi:hypothetical protein